MLHILTYYQKYFVMSQLIKEPSLDIFTLKLDIKKHGWILICSVFLMILSTCLTFRASQVVLVVKNLPVSAGDVKRPEFDPWVRKSPWSRKRQPTPVFLSRESHGERGLVG